MAAKLPGLLLISALFAGITGQSALALSLDEAEFKASRLLACVLAAESLGQLDDDEYGSLTYGVLDGFDDSERDTIYAKALGYFDGLMFAIPDDDQEQVDRRLERFVSSSSCDTGGAYRATVSL